MRTINWKYVKSVLGARREEKRMKALGFRRHQPDWELQRGFLIGGKISEVQIRADGQSIWTKLSHPDYPDGFMAGYELAEGQRREERQRNMTQGQPLFTDVPKWSPF